MSRFISFEGCDGSGKSTQSKILAQWIAEQGYEVVHTREPGGSPGAEQIRALILNGDADRWSAETELLLFTAARRDHVELVIRPALERGAFVVCDRFTDSTRIYQGATRGDLRDQVDALHELMIGIEPDLTILVDIDPQTSYERSVMRSGHGGAEMRFESMGDSFQARLHAGFSSLAAQYPERVLRIDGTGTQAMVAGRILSAVCKRFRLEEALIPSL